MQSSLWVWANRNTGLKIIGIGLLIAYFCNHAFHVDWFWVVADLEICFGITLLSVVFFHLIAAPIIERILPSKQFNPTWWYANNVVNDVKRAPFRAFALIPGEDGFFFVPLLGVGITPLTAAVAAALFAGAHYPQYSVKDCVTKFAVIWCIACVVLPHGLGSVIVAHLIIDALAFGTLALLYSDPSAPRAAIPTMDRSVCGQERR